MGTSKMAVNHLRIISRGLSTSVGRLQLVQPPVQVFGIEGRYATALYSAATKKKALAAVEKDLKTFEATLKKDARLADFLAAHRGEVVCEITTSKALDAAMKKEVDGAVASFLTKGQKSLISYKVDPSIVGGMIVSIGDKYVDMSIASKLKKYSELIKSAA